MKKSKDYKKLFEEIHSTKEFERLEPFLDSKEWELLNEEERQMLSNLFVSLGEKQLVEGDNKVFESFRIANRIVPNNPGLLYRQAVAFSNQSHNQFCLETACKIFETIIDIQPEHFDVWHGWGNTLVLLGSMNQKSEILFEALNKYAEAEKLSARTLPSKLAHFYRDQGLCWYSSGKISGEPQDFKQAVLLYQKAAKMGLSEPSFWNDFGNAVNEIAQLINKPDMIIEAVERYWRSIKLSKTYFAGWYNLATSLKVLYQLHPQEAYYNFASQCFQQGTKVEPHNSTLWTKWGELQAFKGKICRDIDLLQDSCKKFEVADICEPNHPHILSSWGESLLHIGAWTEDQSKLKESLGKILKSLEIQQDIPKVWCLYGNCLNEFGRYHKEEKFFLQAAEKFQFGLQLHAGDPLLWYGLALSIFALGQMRDDVALVKEASQYCMKVIEAGGHNIPQFWNDWGLALMKLGNMTDEKKHLKSSINKFEQALRISGSSGTKNILHVEILYNLGCSYEFLGDYEEEPSCYEKAANLFRKVLGIDPSFYNAHFNLGCVYCRLGELTQDIEFFIEANKQFEKVVAYDSEDDQAWNEWGVSLLNIAELGKDPLRPDLDQKFYNEAEKKFFHSAGLGNISATYHLACLYSLTENYEASVYFLEKCGENNGLPSLDDILLDDWLENVRQTPLFLHFLSQIERKEY